jgi:hypothetical protein
MIKNPDLKIEFQSECAKGRAQQRGQYQHEQAI